MIKLSNIEKMFAEHLREYHLGADNAIKAKHLTRFAKDKELRDIVHALRVNGIPICSGKSGYYYAESHREVFATVKNLKSRVTQIEKAYDGLLDTYYEMKTEEIINKR